MTERRVPGRAHTDEEKRAIVERLFTAWTSSPGARHLRLGQLIANAVGSGDQVFRVEDAQLAGMVEDLIARR